ncbi:hypothetical protein BO78DRAFT_386883 [Aspergillus sclerotiicarbonarius CBS 121057]|uniref:Uncharacterized protein n=1 Tax=Aspergillus sclerotiicarbonarius (strain CBS 121057 / IBT 28362) TaxID=1448318 RepID=A0A319E8Q8_ASPSB|nr:hypothetical protein BO78DRAFT_386883 [Aspergillus sclerotiicarbonarius CBS 121057]
MTATIFSSIVELDKIVPQVIDTDREERDIEKLIPWPQEQIYFKDVFYQLDSHHLLLGASRDVTLSGALTASETITLPRKNWRVPSREYFTHFIRSQGMILRVLMQTIYVNLEDIHEQGPPLLVSSFPAPETKHKYVIGGKRYASIPEGAVMVGPQERALPIVSYVGWFEGQTWKEFLAEVLSIMLGQLAANLGGRVQDQEIYVIGFYRRYIYLARGIFTTDLISRVHAQGCAENEAFELKFTRGYDLYLKEDWLEAMRALTRLFRYLFSGNAKVGALQDELHGSADSPYCIG